jgi:hypothetical protein
MASPSGSLEEVPSKLIVRGVGPLVELAEARATGGSFPAKYRTRRTVPPLRST